MATKPVFDDVKPFPGKPAPEAVGSRPGHNRQMPADDVLREFRDLLSQRDGFVKRCDDLVAAAGRAVATNEETAGRCGELVKQIGAAERVINDAHKSAKEPYLEATRAVDAAKRDTLGPLADAKATVNGKLNTYLREERQRQEAERRRQEEERRAAEAERIRREEEACAKSGGLTCQEASPLSGATYIACGKPAERSIRLPKDGRAYNMCAACAHHNVKNRGGIDEGEATPDNPPVVVDTPEPEPVAAAPEPTRIRGDFGTLTSARVEWKSQVTDYEVAFIAAGLAQNAKVQEVIDKVIQSQVKGGVRKIDGVRIYEDVKAQVR